MGGQVSTLQYHLPGLLTGSWHRKVRFEAAAIRVLLQYYGDRQRAK